MLLSLVCGLVFVVVVVSGHYDPTNPHHIHTKDGIINNSQLQHGNHMHEPGLSQLLPQPSKWVMQQSPLNNNQFQRTYPRYPTNFFTGGEAFLGQRPSSEDRKKGRMTRKGRRLGPGRKIRGRKFVNRVAQLRNSPVFRNMLQGFGRMQNTGRVGLRNKRKGRKGGKRTRNLGSFGFRKD